MKKSNGTKAVKTEVELSVIEKVRKLLEFSVENGATESEVENAMKLAQRLMMKHNLEQKDIELTSKDVNVTRLKSSWKDGMEARSFESQLLNTLSKIYSCRMIVDRNKSTNTDYYDITGLPEDRETVVTLYESILPQVRNLTKKRFKELEIKISQFRFTTSYQTGFLQGLRKKLESDRETFLTLDSEKESFGLIVIKKEALVDEYIKENMNIKSVKIKASLLNKASFEKGVEDGSEKQLNQQLGA